MQTIRFQFLSVADNKPLPTIYECDVLRKEQSETYPMPSFILSRKKASVINADGYMMQPRKIRRLTNGKWELAYGFPRGKSWSQGSFFTEIHIIEIIPIENSMNREKLKTVAGYYFKNQLGAEPDTLQFTYSEDGVREYNLRATLGNRIFEIYMLPLHNRVELIEKRHAGRFEDVAADAGYNSDLGNL